MKQILVLLSFPLRKIKLGAYTGQAPSEAGKANSKPMFSNGNMTKISAAAGFLVSTRRDKPREVGLGESLGQQ